VASLPLPRRRSDQKNKKKACNSFAHPIKPRELKTEKRKVLTHFWRFSYKTRFSLKLHPHQ
jgi:hypothetical protein